MNCEAHGCANDARTTPTEFFFTSGFSKSPMPIFRAYFCLSHSREILDHQKIHGHHGGCKYAENLMAKTDREKKFLKVKHIAEDFRPLILLGFGVLFWICLELFT